MGIVKKVVHVFANISYILILIYAMICAPMIFGYKPLVVLSGSMEPSIKTGSVIYYSKVSEDALKVGDIITFKTNSKSDFITHRINKIENGKYETKGDANKTPDLETITFSNIVGKDLNISIPYIGYYIRFVNNNLYLIVIIVILLILEYVFTNILDKKKGE